MANDTLLEMEVDSDRLRFRQHMAHEMADYTCNCRDAVLVTSNGWAECVD